MKSFFKSIWEFFFPSKPVPPVKPPEQPIKGEPEPVTPEPHPYEVIYRNGLVLITRDGLEMCKHFEGLFLKAYKDPVDVVTIGYGRIRNSDGSPVKSGQTCTEAQAEEWLLEDLEREGAKYVRAFYPNWTSLKLNVWSAYVDFTFNRGAGRFRDGPAVYLKKEDHTMAVANLLTFDWAGNPRRTLEGLERRRHAEKLMIEGKDWRALDTVAKFRAFKARGFV